MCKLSKKAPVRLRRALVDSFGGAIALIFADLIILPTLNIYRNIPA